MKEQTKYTLAVVTLGAMWLVTITGLFGTAFKQHTVTALVDKPQTAAQELKPIYTSPYMDSKGDKALTYAPGDMQCTFLVAPPPGSKQWALDVLDEVKNPKWVPEVGDTWGSSKGRALVIRRHIKKMGTIYVLNIWCRLLTKDEWNDTVQGKFANTVGELNPSPDQTK